MAKERLDLNDSMFDICHKMSEGNPGALTVVMQLLGPQGAQIDPDAWLGGLGAVLALDTLGLYGPKIWMLYKDVCKEDLVKMCAVLRARQLGYVTAGQVTYAVDHYGEGIDPDELLTSVRERLPKFGTVAA